MVELDVVLINCLRLTSDGVCGSLWFVVASACEYLWPVACSSGTLRVFVVRGYRR